MSTVQQLQTNAHTPTLGGHTQWTSYATHMVMHTETVTRNCWLVNSTAAALCHHHDGVSLPASSLGTQVCVIGESEMAEQYQSQCTQLPCVFVCANRARVRALARDASL